MLVGDVQMDIVQQAELSHISVSHTNENEGERLLDAALNFETLPLPVQVSVLGKARKQK